MFSTNESIQGFRIMKQMFVTLINDLHSKYGNFDTIFLRKQTSKNNIDIRYTKQYIVVSIITDGSKNEIIDEQINFCLFHYF